MVVLCERSQLKDLVQFPFVNLHDEVISRTLGKRLTGGGANDLPAPQVVSIIESRARGLDLLAHNYYELLYAFHINRHNYRKGVTATHLSLGKTHGAAD